MTHQVIEVVTNLGSIQPAKEKVVVDSADSKLTHDEYERLKKNSSISYKGPGNNIEVTSSPLSYMGCPIKSSYGTAISNSPREVPVSVKMHELVML